MEHWREMLYKLGSEAETAFDQFKLNFRSRMGFETNIQICPYISFGNRNSLYVKGRVLHNRQIEVKSRDELWDNLVNMYKRFNSHEIKGAHLKISFQGQEKEITTDEDGYFGEDLILDREIISDDLWCYPELELLSSPVSFTPPVRSRASVMVPGIKAKFGVISDIDDTILKTNATDIIKMMYYTFTNNAHSRTAFPGVARFYRALQKGATGEENNPFFYISSSPWNLYDFLVDFISVNDLPKGPLFLKDYGFSHNKIVTESHQLHKPKKIRKVMNAYPNLPFILIGDSGQADPEIYHEIIKEYPNRILAVYIRDVSDQIRDQEINKIEWDQSVEMVYGEDSDLAMAHAMNKGFISATP